MLLHTYSLCNSILHDTPRPAISVRVELRSDRYPAVNLQSGGAPLVEKSQAHQLGDCHPSQTRPDTSHHCWQE
jgi:hypothetical protein